MPPKRKSKRNSMSIFAERKDNSDTTNPITLIEYLEVITPTGNCGNPLCTNCKSTQDSSKKRDLSPPPHYVSKSKFSRHLFCPVCMEVFNHPVRLFCGHVYCAPCIKQIWFKALQTGSGCCPLDRIDIRWEHMHFDLVIKKLLAAQEVYCPNRKNSCPWEGLKRDQADHLKECLYKEVPVWLATKIQKDKTQTKEDFMEDEELAEILEREAPNVDLMTRMYFKDQNLVKNVMTNQTKPSNGPAEVQSMSRRKVKTNRKASNDSEGKTPVRLTKAVNDLLDAFDEQGDIFNIDKLLDS